MRYLTILPILLLVGCSSRPVKPQDPCADIPVYEPYKIETPQRPKLGLDMIDQSASAGATVRVTETDYIELMKYAQELENIIKAVPNDVVTPKR